MTADSKTFLSYGQKKLFAGETGLVHGEEGLDRGISRYQFLETASSPPLTLFRYLEKLISGNYTKPRLVCFTGENSTMHQSHSNFSPSDTGIEDFLEDFQSFTSIPLLYMALSFPLSLALTWLPLLETAPVSCSAPWTKQAWEGAFMCLMRCFYESLRVFLCGLVRKVMWLPLLLCYEIPSMGWNPAPVHKFSCTKLVQPVLCVIVPALGFAFQGHR